MVDSAEVGLNEGLIRQTRDVKPAEIWFGQLQAKMSANCIIKVYIFFIFWQPWFVISNLQSLLIKNDLWSNDNYLITSVSGQLHSNYVVTYKSLTTET